MVGLLLVPMPAFASSPVRIRLHMASKLKYLRCGLRNKAFSNAQKSHRANALMRVRENIDLVKATTFVQVCLVVFFRL